MTRWDRILVLAVLAVALLSAPAAFAMRDGSGDTLVVTGPAGASELPMERDAVYEIAGREGSLRLVVRDGDAFISEADCPDHVCVDTGTVKHSGAIVCAPNGVSVRLSSGEGAYDARSR